MTKYKVNFEWENKDFVFTKSFKKLYRALLSLKTDKGRFILVIGAPGTGKSANIYSALKILDLNIYDPIFFLDSVKISSINVYREFFKNLREDLGVGTNKEVYTKVKDFDAVLLADKILDSEFIDENKLGLSLWTEYNGIKAFPFYALVFLQYLKHQRDLKDVNVIIQTAFMIKIRGVKYDLLTDFSLLSKMLVFMVKLFMEVVEISNSEEETIEIVKKQLKDVDEEQIKLCINKYGCKPRFILETLEKAREKTD
jgi:hypothetical protein